LFSKRIGLPNDSDFRYDKYTIPCCEPCNSRMGLEIETPISELVARGYDAVSRYLVREGPWLFFIWFNLIFIKTHLKDKSVRLHQDRRKPDDRISDHYTWEELHFNVSEQNLNPTVLEVYWPYVGEPPLKRHDPS